MIETDRTILKLLDASFFDALHLMYQEPETFQFIAPLRGKDKAFFDSFLKRKMNEIESGKAYYWVILSKTNQSLIGAINLTPIPNTDQIQIGWQIKKAFHRQSFASETARAALHFAIQHSQINPIYAVYEEGNVASEKIVKKLGFEWLEDKNVNGILLHKYIGHAPNHKSDSSSWAPTSGKNNCNAT